MNASASILLIVMSGQGYWFGGQAGIISLQWALASPPAEAVVEWNLLADGVRLSGDRMTMPAGTEPSRLSLTVPKVRVPTVLRWAYQVRERLSGRSLESGEAKIHVFPQDLLASLPKQLNAKRLLVVEHGGELTGVLEKAGIHFDRAASIQELQFARPDLLLIGPDEIANDPFSQAPLIEHARAGASVAVLPQTRAERLAGYPVSTRALPAKMEWRQTHPLLVGLNIPDLQSLLNGRPTAPAIQLPADEPALEIAWWPPEVAGDKPVPIDALIVTKAIGQGRLILWQAPLGSWQTDPRSQQVLANLLGYMTTRPEPTPPPSRRPVSRPPASQPVPTITIPPGGRPQ